MPSEQDILDQQTRLEIHRRNLSIYLNKKAIKGYDVNLDVEHGIQYERREIQRIKNILENWGVIYDNHPDDQESENNTPIINNNSIYSSNNSYIYEDLIAHILQELSDNNFIFTRGVFPSNITRYCYIKNNQYGLLHHLNIVIIVEKGNLSRDDLLEFHEKCLNIKNPDRTPKIFIGEIQTITLFILTNNIDISIACFLKENPANKTIKQSRHTRITIFPIFLINIIFNIYDSKNHIWYHYPTD